MTSNAGSSAATTTNARDFRYEIQGLRALAVGLVLIYHLWPHRLSGGFVGVDVFFVISGFLITGHLYRELQNTGTINLAKFWTRRIMRLLPLAFTVLLFSMIMLIVFMPETTWENNLRHIIGSVFYLENWLLAADSVDYSAQAHDAPMVQHYWSLSVEEQFYVLLPLVMLLGIITFRWISKPSDKTKLPVRTVMIVILALVGVASFIFSVFYTSSNPATGYFITPTRFWEFCVGGLLALAPAPGRDRLLWRDLAGWSGLGMIIAAALLFSSQTIFPGYAALLPVVGTALFLRFGTQHPVIGVWHWASQTPFVKLGDWSYAIYLWHWPLIVLATSLSESFFWYHKLLIAVIAIALSVASQKFIEDPMRHLQRFKVPWRGFSFMGAGMVLLSISALVAPSIFSTATSKEFSYADECVGANAVYNDCSEEEILTTEILESPANVSNQNDDLPRPECVVDAGFVEDDGPCFLGAPLEESDRTVAVIGDSHARMWLWMIEDIALERNWTVLGYTKSGCTPVPMDRSKPEDMDPTSDESACTEFVREKSEEIRDNDSIEVVFTAASRVDRTYYDESGRSGDNVIGAGLEEMWQSWSDAGKDVIVIEESPHFGSLNVPQCVELEGHSALSECSLPQEITMKRQANLAHAAELSQAISGSFDPSTALCFEGTCYPIIGGLITYYDSHHLSEEFSRTYKNEFEEFLESIEVLN